MENRLSYSFQELCTVSFLEHSLRTRRLSASSSVRERLPCNVTDLQRGFGSPSSSEDLSIPARANVFVTFRQRKQDYNFLSYHTQDVEIMFKNNTLISPVVHEFSNQAGINSLYHGGFQLNTKYVTPLDNINALKFIENAKCLLFDLELEVPLNASNLGYQSEFHGQLAVMCRILDDNIRRCRSLRIRVNLHSTIYFLCQQFQKFRKPLKYLEELHLEVDFYFANLSQGDLFAEFSNPLPALRIVKVGALCQVSQVSYEISVLHLDTRSVSFAKLHFILFDLRNLQELALYNSFAESRPIDLLLSPVELPFLASLQLYDHTPMALEHFLFHLLSPNLRELVIARLFWGSFDSLNENFEKSHPSVTILSLVLHGWYSVNNDAFGIRKAATRFPNVEEVTFYGSHPHMAVDILQTPIENDKMAFEKLKSIALESGIPLRKFVEARKIHGVPLSTIYLTEKARREQRDIEWLTSSFSEVEVKVRDVLEERRKDGLYHPQRTYGRCDW